MHAAHVPMQIRPAHASHVATGIRAVVSQEQHCILEDVRLLVLDAQVVVVTRKGGVGVVVVSLQGIIGEDDVFSVGLPSIHSSQQRRPRAQRELTLQWAQALVLYKALNLKAQM